MSTEPIENADLMRPVIGPIRHLHPMRVSPLGGRERCERLHERVADQAAAERALGIAHLSPAQQHVWALVNKGAQFVACMTHEPDAVQAGPLIEALLDEALGAGWNHLSFISNGSLVHVRRVMDRGDYRHVGELSMRDLDAADAASLGVARIQQQHETVRTPGYRRKLAAISGALAEEKR